MKSWSEKIKNLTREKAGDGAMLKSLENEYGFFSTDGNGIKILGVKSNMGFPLPSDEVIARYADIEAMIDAGWVID